jgi:hypothetical protein
MIPEQELKKLGNGGLEERAEPCQEEWQKRKEDIGEYLMSIVDRCLGHGQEPESGPPSPCWSDESFVRQVAMHICKEVSPLRFANGGGGSRSCICVASLVLLLLAFLAHATILDRMVAPHHVVGCPVVYPIVVLLFMQLAVLGRHALPFLHSLLLLFILSILFIFLLALLLILFDVVLLLPIFLVAGCALEIGSEDKLTLQSRELCLHGNDLLFE